MNHKTAESVPRRERKAIKKLQHSYTYKILLGLCVFFFTPVKKFIFLPFWAARKVFWVISLSIYKVFWQKIAYVDDFIIHKKLRGKWYGKQLFTWVEDEAKKQHCDYLLLFSRKDRKASHRFYKKAWLTIIWVWIGIVAYKKFRK